MVRRSDEGRTATQSRQGGIYEAVKTDIFLARLRSSAVRQNLPARWPGSFNLVKRGVVISTSR